MNSNELRQKYLDFFEQKGHSIIPSASIVPENDPTVLFTTAGMHPLVPYLMGEEHPEGTRLADAQKCLRTGDIDEVGDNRHLTFFEMLGNWSLGDYFKEEAITWSMEFLTGDEWLNIDPENIYVSVYRGDEDVPRDEEAIELWKEAFSELGIEATVADAENPDINEGHKIFPYGKEHNWWGPPGVTGPCGPDTEMYVDTGRDHDADYGEVCHPACDCGRFIELWNDVFMQYNKDEEGNYTPLKQKNVDTGMGLERAVALLNGKDTVFEIDTFQAILKTIGEISDKTYKENESDDQSMRIIADHIRASVFVLGDPVAKIVPSNTDQGYILRRLIRRAVRHGKQLDVEGTFLAEVAETVIELFGEAYPELKESSQRIKKELTKEEEKFHNTLEKGLKKFEKMFEKNGEITGEDAFILYSTFGFPLELTRELANEKGQQIDIGVFEEEFEKHQEKSRAGAKKKFAGGLADHSDETVRLHTATHLLHRALKNVLGEHVEQKGSNIKPERLRFDFSHPEGMTDEEIEEVEDMINEQIEKDLDVHYEVMSLEEAKERGAIGLFEEKYDELDNKIKVYFIGDPDTDTYFSIEVCGGPHVEHTGELGAFKIKKEKSNGAGIRRIKAVVSGPDGWDEDEEN
jgi:alanyl-tRNA synthetase